MVLSKARSLAKRVKKRMANARKQRDRRKHELAKAEKARLKEIQRSFHNDPKVAVQAYFVHNGRGLGSRLNCHRQMIRRAVEFNYLNWPRKIMNDVKGKDVLDVGCGTGLHAVGFLVVGVKSYTGLDPYVDLQNDIARNYRAKRTPGYRYTLEEMATRNPSRDGRDEHFGWTPAQMRRRLPRVDLIPGTFEQVAPSRTFDVAVLHNVTEHLIQIDEVFEGVWRLLRPDGEIVFNHHNFYCWNGHHLPPKFVSEIDPADPDQENFMDWNHVVYDPVDDHYIAWGLNRIRLDELRALTERYFHVERWDESRTDEDRGVNRLTDEIRARHAHLTQRELTTQNVLCRGRKRPEPLALEKARAIAAGSLAERTEPVAGRA